MGPFVVLDQLAGGVAKRQILQRKLVAISDWVIRKDGASFWVEKGTGGFLRERGVSEEETF